MKTKIFSYNLATLWKPCQCVSCVDPLSALTEVSSLGTG